MRIAVIGAGIVGLSAAWTLRASSHEVVLIDSESGPARGASGRNGAQLSYAFVQPLASPATLAGMPSLLMSSQSPLRLRPGLSLSRWEWCLRFLWACRPGQSERGARALLDLAALSRERFAAWRGEVDPTRIAYRRTGKLVLYRDTASWRAALRQMAAQAPHGPPQEALAPAECLRLEPALDAQQPLQGGIFTPGEEVADCEAVCAELCDALLAQDGVQAHWGAAALRWITLGDRVLAVRVLRDGQWQTLQADAFVVACGIGAPALLSGLGVHLPLTPLKGYSIELPAPCLGAMPGVSVTDHAAKTVFAPLGSAGDTRLRVAGMAELVGADRRIDPRRVAQLLDGTRRVFDLRQVPADLRPWAGLRPAMPDSLPRIGALARWPNVFVDAGHGALGFTLAFGSAAVLAAAIERRASPLKRHDFAGLSPALEGDR